MRLAVCAPAWALCLSGLMLGTTAAAEGDAPSSAADVSGNVKSFFDKLGKSVSVNPNRKIVATGHIDGKGDAVCYEGEAVPVIVRPQSANAGGGKITAVLLPCAALIANGVLHPVGAIATADGAPPYAATSRRPAQPATAVQVCPGDTYPNDDARYRQQIGEVICVNRFTGAYTGQIQNTKTFAFRPITQQDADYLRKRDIHVGVNGGVPDAGNVDKAFAKTDALVAQAKANAEAEAQAREQRAQATQGRAAVLRQCRAKATGGDGAENLRKCLDEANRQFPAAR